MQRRETRLEQFVTEHSYEEITGMETQFIMSLYEAVDELVRNGEKVSLPRISKKVRVSPKELMDYLAEIVEMERQINLSINE